jgi:hypothetical protein
MLTVKDLRFKISPISKGFGVHLSRNKDNFYCAESKSSHSIYIILKTNPDEQILLEPGILWRFIWTV